MPRKPQISTLNANSVGILNTIRDQQTAAYQEAVPVAAATTESIRMVGTAIMAEQQRQNAFLSALVNRIGLTLVTSKMFQNPLAVFKRGTLELGETVEEIFTRIAEPFQFDPELAETTLHKRVIPDVKAMFHQMNFQKFYKVTVSPEQLRQAFLSFEGVYDLVDTIVNSLFSAMQVDEFLMTKYIFAVLALNGSIYPVATGDFNQNGADEVLRDAKKLSNDFRFLDTAYNPAGVENFSPIERQYLFETSEFSANIDVYALAKAFNLEYAEFLGKTVMVNSFAFSDFEQARVTKLLGDDPSFDPTVFRADNTALLKTIGAILVDRDFFMIFDVLQESRTVENGQGLNYNQILHVWRIFSASPFANAALLTSSSASTITNVTVTTPVTAYGAYDGLQIVPTVSVTGANFYSKGVTWTATVKSGSGSAVALTPANGGTIGANGVVTITDKSKLPGDSTTLTITATSTQDSTKSGSKAVTLTR